MTPAYIATGLVLGAVGALGHLAATRFRVNRLRARGPVFMLVSFPLGLVSIAATVLVAAQVSLLSAWVLPLGLLGTRWAILARERSP